MVITSFITGWGPPCIKKNGFVMNMTCINITRLYNSLNKSQCLNPIFKLIFFFATSPNNEESSTVILYPKDHWTLKTGYFEDPTPAIQVQTLPLEGPRALGYHENEEKFQFQKHSFWLQKVHQWTHK